MNIPRPFLVPSVGFLIEYDGQVYTVGGTDVKVILHRDSAGRERYQIEAIIRGEWHEDDYNTEGDLI